MNGDGSDHCEGWLTRECRLLEHDLCDCHAGCTQKYDRKLEFLS